MKLPEPFRAAGEHITIDLGDARVVYTTRRGGESEGPYASLNLGILTDDDRDVVRRNRDSLAGELGVGFVHGRQVHGTHVARSSQPVDLSGPPVEQADGQATATPGLAPLVLTADCLAIAIAGDGAIAMVHAGWRGLAGGVIGEGVTAVRELGATGPLRAAIGPGAGPCCYEVGEEVHAAFAQYGGVVRRGGNLDLPQIAGLELARCGVGEVHDVALCTICSDPGLFFSHRRDHGVTGRQAGIAWLS
jgi:polyphenol oxidase